MNNNSIEEKNSACLSEYSDYKMLSPGSIVHLYDNVLSSDVDYYDISKKDIRSAIRNMTEAYKPNISNWKQEVAKVADYNDPAHRCAYLHKYAALHTSLVQDMFSRALAESSILWHALISNLECLKICSLGGGPGTDVIGILAAVNQKLGLLPCSVQIVELMSEWENTFNSIVEELYYGYYGTLSQNLDPEYFDSSYVTADLLDTMDNIVNMAIGSANLITMVKFVSATTCKDTAGMVKKIFNSMKPGALVLFIDNAAGGFSELITRLAQECQLSTVFGPLNHEYYGNDIFRLERYGYTSCFGTTVTVHLLMKSCKNQNEFNFQTSLTYYNKNVNAPLVLHSSSNVANSVYPSPTQSSETKKITTDKMTAAVGDRSISRNVPAVTNQSFFPKELDLSSKVAQQERDMYPSELPDLKTSFGNISHHTKSKQLPTSVSQYSTACSSDSHSSKIKAEMGTVQIPPQRNININKWEVSGNKTDTYGTFSTGSSLCQLETKPLNSSELISRLENVVINKPYLDSEKENWREVWHSTEEYSGESNLSASTSADSKQPVNEINGKAVKNIKNSEIGGEVTTESEKNVNSLTSLPQPVNNERHFQGAITATQPSVSDLIQRKEPLPEDEHTLDDQTCNCCLNINVFTNICKLWCCIKNSSSQ